eukprot:Cvel_5634.t1-p1 / transcript=Cvel_5634.t1 / gene=Cvel_5634 / organism=Chromera_velia_CCMP2878 / gene_product=hypothetical protein / transcript_product=hypothetical protein / location=Cvel_scaffold265:86878-87141(+) / protein_length=88 / sequence_SO=supercontig / SO=protein_coding / is_pseudo=false
MAALVVAIEFDILKGLALPKVREGGVRDVVKWWAERVAELLRKWKAARSSSFFFGLFLDEREIVWFDWWGIVSFTWWGSISWSVSFDW